MYTDKWIPCLSHSAWQATYCSEQSGWHALCFGYSVHWTGSYHLGLGHQVKLYHLWHSPKYDAVPQSSIVFCQILPRATIGLVQAVRLAIQQTPRLDWGLLLPEEPGVAFPGKQASRVNCWLRISAEFVASLCFSSAGGSAAASP